MESDDSVIDASLWTHAAKMLQMLQGFFHTRNVPNYCIPANNMISHVDVSDCRLITSAIQKVLDDPIGAILQIHRDVAVLRYELNVYRNGMIKVLQDLGFKTSPWPHFSILNSTFQGLHDVVLQRNPVSALASSELKKQDKQPPKHKLQELSMKSHKHSPKQPPEQLSKKHTEQIAEQPLKEPPEQLYQKYPEQSAEQSLKQPPNQPSKEQLEQPAGHLIGQVYKQHSKNDCIVYDAKLLKAFLRGSLSTGLCFVQIEPKIFAARIMIDAFSAFTASSGICMKCRQEISIIDLMFWMMLHEVTSTPFLTPELQNSIKQLVTITCNTGHNTNPHYMLPFTNKLPEFFTQQNHKAQCYRWCAILGLWIELKEAQQKEIPTFPLQAAQDKSKHQAETTIGKSENQTETTRNKNEHQAEKTGGKSEHLAEAIEGKSGHQAETTRGITEHVAKATAAAKATKTEQDIIENPISLHLVSRIILSMTKPTDKTDYSDTRIMFPKALAFSSESTVFSTVVALEYTMYLLHKGEIESAKAIVESITMYDLVKYDAAHVLHARQEPCLMDLLKIPKCEKIHELELKLHSIIQDTYGIDVELKPFGMMCH